MDISFLQLPSQICIKVVNVGSVDITLQAPLKVYLADVQVGILRYMERLKTVQIYILCRQIQIVCIVQIQVVQIVQISHGGQSVCCRPVNYITAVRRHGKTSLACSRARGIQIVDHVSFSNQGLPGHQWHPDCSASKCRVIDTVTVLRRNLHKFPTVRGRVTFLSGYDIIVIIYLLPFYSILSLIHRLATLFLI